MSTALNDIPLTGANRDFNLARIRDPKGDVVHLILAIALTALIGFGTAPPAILSAIVGGYALLRIWATAGTYRTLLASPLFHVLLIWLALNALSMLWTVDRTEGLDELSDFRLQIPVLLALWPIIDRWRLLLWGLIAGSSVIALTQILHRFDVTFFVEAAWPRSPGRYPGFVHPMNTAVIHATAVSLAVGPLLLGRSRGRAAAALVVILGIVGLLLAGSRNLWLAAAAGSTVSIASTLLVFGYRSQRSGRSLGRLIAWGVAVLVLLTLLAIPVAGRLVVERVGDAVDDVASAIEEGDYRSHGGARLRQLQLARTLMWENPVGGIGVGAYRIEARRLADREKREALGMPPFPEEGADGQIPGIRGSAPRGEPFDRSGSTLPAELRDPVLPHPHSALAHAASTLGIPGLLVYLLIWGIIAWSAAMGVRQVLVRSRCSDGGDALQQDGHRSPAAATHIAGDADAVHVGETSRDDLSRQLPFIASLPGAVGALFVAFTLDCHNLSAQGAFVLFLIAAIVIRPLQLSELPTPWWSWTRSR
ncbi:MAG: O-antigen ligase family protein, partial [Planctomycetota bacterium]